MASSTSCTSNWVWQSPSIWVDHDSCVLIRSPAALGACGGALFVGGGIIRAVSLRVHVSWTQTTGNAPHRMSTTDTSSIQTGLAPTSIVRSVFLEPRSFLGTSTKQEQLEVNQCAPHNCGDEDFGELGTTTATAPATPLTPSAANDLPSDKLLRVRANNRKSNANYVKRLGRPLTKIRKETLYLEVVHLRSKSEKLLDENKALLLSNSKLHSENLMLRDYLDKTQAGMTFSPEEWSRHSRDITHAVARITTLEKILQSSFHPQSMT